MTILINIDVPDLDAAERFYTAAFGLVAGRRIGAGAVELLGWPAPLYLLQKKAETIGVDGDQRRYMRHWTPVHIDVAVDDLDAALATALGAGARLEQGPQDAAYGRIAMLGDPYGHGFCLIQFNQHGYDALI
ncbi:VOC family protein [Sphingomonas sp.]|uniref:VOC family protein n=1 Tax=Sphingomonas sp. TaxID=28214 RepID=UPI0025E9929A|nr:VOC family protein [Sphingomonas sp.]MBV9527325.1 hypothetical protein [Sphingomonas sp.]